MEHATGNTAPAGLRLRTRGLRLARRLGHVWVWLAALGVGLYLRLDQLGAQILGDDEWHSLAFLKDHGYRLIASGFGASDYSIPLTLLHRLLYDTVGLSELRVRLAPLSAGLAALVALPLLVRPVVGLRAAQLLALLLALSPLQVYFSRSARPYSISLLLSTLALLCFYRWWQERAIRWAVAYVGCAALAPWFHLTVAPFVLTPPLVAALHGWCASTRRSLRDGSRLVLPGLVAGIAALALLAPALVFDWRTLLDKGGAAEPLSLYTFREVITLLGGTAQPLVLLLGCSVSSVGLALLLRRQPAFGTLIAAASAAQLAGVLLARPHIAHVGIVFVRYALPVAVVGALGVAVALAAWSDRGEGPRQRRLREIACVVLILAWAASGPLPWTHRRPNAWTNHGAFQFDYDFESNDYWRLTMPTRIPRFYSELAALPGGSVVIAEAPFHIEWHKNNYVFYQMLHHQHEVVADVNELTTHASPAFRSDDPRVRFENVLPLTDLSRLAARGVRYLVLHRDLSREISDWEEPPGTDMAPVIRYLQLQCGAPIERDDLIVVFDLERCPAVARRPPQAPD